MALTLMVLPASRAVRVNVSDFGATTPTIWRRAGNEPLAAEVRMAVMVSTAASYIGVDYEAPMDVPLYYEARSEMVEGGWSDLWDDDWEASGDSFIQGPVLIPSNNEDWVVALGQPALSRVALVESFPELTRGLSHSLVRPLRSKYGLPILHASLGAVGTLTLLALTLGETAALRSMIELSPLLQLKCPPNRGLPGGVLYLLVKESTEQRATRLGTEPSRRFILSVEEVARPPLEVLVPNENTWQMWEDEPLANGTWAVWAEMSWLDVLIQTGVGDGS